MHPVQQWVLLGWVPKHLVWVIFKEPHDIRAWMDTEAASLDHFPMYILCCVCDITWTCNLMLEREPSNGVLSLLSIAVLITVVIDINLRENSVWPCTSLRSIILPKTSEMVLLWYILFVCDMHNIYMVAPLRICWDTSYVRIILIKMWKIPYKIRMPFFVILPSISLYVEYWCDCKW